MPRATGLLALSSLWKDAVVLFKQYGVWFEIRKIWYEAGLVHFLASETLSYCLTWISVSTSVKREEYLPCSTFVCENHD